MSNGVNFDVPAEEVSGIRQSSGSDSSLDSMASTSGQWRPEETISSGGVARLETMESLDWTQVMAQNPNLLGGLLLFYLINFVISLCIAWCTFDLNLIFERCRV